MTTYSGEIAPWTIEAGKIANGMFKYKKELWDARFGMFIHWGPYSLLAGGWKNERIGGLGEWIMYNAKIPVKEYEEVAKQFNRVKFNVDDWVALAREAGDKYIVIT